MKERAVDARASTAGRPFASMPDIPDFRSLEDYLQ